MKKTNFNWKINNWIRAPELRVIGSDGKQLGVMKREEALAKAMNEGVDLIEIAPLAKPPVAKIIELGKFKYQEEKKAKKEKKGAVKSEMKEIRFSPFIADHDFENRLERVKEFLNDRNKVKLVVKFGGRQMGSKQFGYKVVQRVINGVGMEVNVDSEPKFLGRQLMCVISPKGKSKKIVQEVNIENEKQNENQEIRN